MATFAQRMELETAEELDGIIERLDELEDWAVDQGYRALENKCQEARGSLSSAAEAMRQYASGVLTAKTSQDYVADHLQSTSRQQNANIRNHLHHSHGVAYEDLEDAREYEFIHEREHNE